MVLPPNYSIIKNIFHQYENNGYFPPPFSHIFSLISRQPRYSGPSVEHCGGSTPRIDPLGARHHVRANAGSSTEAARPAARPHGPVAPLLRLVWPSPFAAAADLLVSPVAPRMVCAARASGMVCAPAAGPLECPGRPPCGPNSAACSWRLK